MSSIEFFKAFIWDFYRDNRRSFTWRNIDNPYHVLVSEIMLQQTQTYRVIAKYEEFIEAFPTFQKLASASLRDVLDVWQGLGYYRRARYLHQIAQIIIEKYAGLLPNDPVILQTLPGIGAGTAGSIAAFAFNKPTVFIETNIRSVFIHCFFRDKAKISDKELLPLIAATVDYTNPREWYYALMDYGVWCKSQQVNPNRKSAHYTKQSKFKGSDRQLRATILRLIVEKRAVSQEDIIHCKPTESIRIEKIIQQLINENLIKKNKDDVYSIP